jgi:tryptophanyl-tRNA synthetase
MTIGPEPMSKILCSAVFFGIETAEQVDKRQSTEAAGAGGKRRERRERVQRREVGSSRAGISESELLRAPPPLSEYQLFNYHPLTLHPAAEPAPSAWIDCSLFSCTAVQMVRYLTGFQPSGMLHIGNYFGAIKPAVELQTEGEAFYFLADYHALTSIQQPAVLRSYIRESAIDLLACGIDPTRTCFFRQSDVAAVTELAWILSTVTPMGLLERSHSYKDKLARGLPASHGLFAYPILMAADILLYDADVVPVGKDQKQHLEVTRDIANRFNDAFGPVLKVPEPSIRDEVATIVGLDGQKMSKSYGNTIEIFASEKVLRKKVMSIVTDSTPVEAPKDPTKSAIVDFYRLLAPAEDVAKMEARYRAGGVGYGEFKKTLFERLWEFFGPIRERRAEIEAKPEQVEQVLAHGASRARLVADGVMARVRSAVGLR